MSTVEFRDHIGHGVVMQFPGTGIVREDGTITSVNDRYVFVQFAGDVHSKACRPDDLTLLVSSMTTCPACGNATPCPCGNRRTEREMALIDHGADLAAARDADVEFEGLAGDRLHDRNMGRLG